MARITGLLAQYANFVRIFLFLFVIIAAAAIALASPHPALAWPDITGP
jgi:hypothetical protein